MPVLSNKSRARLQGIKPVLIEIIEAAITNSPYDFGIPLDGGLRSAYRQNQLYAQGRTEAGKVITQVDGYKKRSRHQDGDAIDIYAFVDGKASWDIQHLTAIARHLQAVALTFGVVLEWGGDWTKFKDYPHLQILRK